MKAKARDEADIASEQEEFSRQEAMWKAQVGQRMQHRGHCYNCGEPSQKLFCDVDCRRDYEREQSVRKCQRGEQCSGQERANAD